MADDGLLREVDDDVRAERIMALWHRYRSLLTVFVVSVLVATTGHTLWQNYRTHRGGVWLEQLSAAQTQFSQGKFAEAQKTFSAIAQQTSGELAAVAHIWQARALVGDGKIDAAITVLKQTAAQAQGLWGDVACLRLAALSMPDATCLADKNHSPLTVQRGQWEAARLWSDGNHDAAIALVDALVRDTTTPEADRLELQQWLATMKGEK
jgi:hypothetical protein